VLKENALVSFVLPAFNEGKFIEDSLKRLDSSFRNGYLNHEIVVVDDGSEDNTRLKAWKYARRNGHVKIIAYNHNLGKGFAIKTGFFGTAGDAIVFLDSDLDVDVKQVGNYIQALRFGDIVIGSKYHPESVVETSFLRRFLSCGFNILTRLLTGIKIKDTQVGIKAISRDVFSGVFKQLSVKRYAFDVELMVLAYVYGLNVVELPVKLTISNKLNVKDIWHMFLDLLGISYRLRIRKYYQKRF
jgi:glycosyltransferase involved in cell wall biosynthesis